MTPPTAPERCPRCDDPSCDVPAATAATNGIPGFGETCSEDDDAKWAALGEAMRRCGRRRSVNWRARALAAESAAAQWARVAPLIERLREAASVEGGDMMAVVDAATDILAATEPTP